MELGRKALVVEFRLTQVEVWLGALSVASSETPPSPSMTVGHQVRGHAMPRREAQAGSMINRIGRAIAEADGAKFEADPARYRRLAMAALAPLVRPTDAMIDAAHEAVWSDALWAINSRADFKKAVRTMITFAMREHEERGGLRATPHDRRG